MIFFYCFQVSQKRVAYVREDSLRSGLNLMIHIYSERSDMVLRLIHFQINFITSQIITSIIPIN